VPLWSFVPVLIYFKKVKNQNGEKICSCEKVLISCIEIVENGFLNSPKKFTHGLRSKFPLKKDRQKMQVYEILLNIFVQLFAPGGGSEKFRKQHM